VRLFSTSSSVSWQKHSVNLLQRRDGLECGGAARHGMETGRVQQVQRAVMHIERAEQPSACAPSIPFLSAYSH